MISVFIETNLALNVLFIQSMEQWCVLYSVIVRLFILQASLHCGSEIDGDSLAW